MFFCSTSFNFGMLLCVLLVVMFFFNIVLGEQIQSFSLFGAHVLEVVVLLHVFSCRYMLCCCADLGHKSNLIFTRLHPMCIGMVHVVFFFVASGLSVLKPEVHKYYCSSNYRFYFWHLCSTSQYFISEL